MSQQMGAHPLSVSVVVPAYNREATIQQCLRSVLAQTHLPDEILVIDDGSRDRTVQKIAELGDIRIKVIRSNRNLGAQAARNLGILEASSLWIAFLDSDDEWLPNFLYTYLNRARTSGCSVIYGSGFRKTDSACKVMDLPNLEREAHRAMLSGPGPMFGALLVKRDLLLEIGCLDESVPAYQEWDTAIRLAKKATFAYQQEPLFVYHIHEGSRISSNLRRDAEGMEFIFRKHGRDIHSIAGRDVLEQRRADLAQRFHRAGMKNKWRHHKLRYLLNQDGNMFDKYMGLFCTFIFPSYSMTAENVGGAALQVRMRLAGLKKQMKKLVSYD